MFWHTRNVPNIRRILAEGEEITYIGHRHPLYGWEWALAAFACGAAVMVHWYFVVPAVLCFAIYLLPFYLFEAAVTTHRFIVRKGRFHVATEEILPIHLDHWDIGQNILLHMLGGGHVTLFLRYGMASRTTHLKWMCHPLDLVGAIEKLSPDMAPKETKGEPPKPSKLPATVENQAHADKPVKPAPPANKAA
ncbi:MAG TPA: hypothetical protein VHP58_07170 [Alphaproteobacteria bacterium]|nr:hypothetical protein [Alphaproteobacteria bacterium]